ncbi:nascent polypeptide-associated complex subunit alpha, muscle-specific form-like [Mesocricetus auratus]|uniref:Nascent polypeptide-associated complex subunit alpha, muscle-specific form-like n=1 Tax=Mesocricetus auratus TaxID=10036 RepID=A0ABM2Y733_MESAU|nr:nascent polypeptide-associated complex subunit alpha, muscle-specific form-like [Mesocricetus auratus]
MVLPLRHLVHLRGLSFPPLPSVQAGLFPSRHELLADSVAALSVRAPASAPAPPLGKGTSALTGGLCGPPSSSAVATTPLCPTASLTPKGSNATQQPLVTQIPASQNTVLKEIPVSGVGAEQPAVDDSSSLSLAPCVSPPVSSDEDPTSPTVSSVAPAAHEQFPAPPLSATLGVPVSLPATEDLKNLPAPVLINVGAPVSPPQAGHPARRDPTLLPLSLIAHTESSSPQSASSVEECAPLVKMAVARSSSPGADTSAAIVRTGPASLPPKHSVTVPAVAPGLLESCGPEELSSRTARGTSPAASTTATSALIPLASEGCPLAPSLAFTPQNGSVSMTAVALAPEISKSVSFPASPPTGISFSGAKEGDGLSSVASLPSFPEGHPEDSGAHPASFPSLETDVSPRTKGPSPKKSSALPGVSPAGLLSPLSTPEPSFLPGASPSPIPPSSKGAPVAPTETSVSPQKAPATSFLKDAPTVPAEIPLFLQKTIDSTASKLDLVTRPPNVPPVVPDMTPLSPKKTPAAPVPKDTSATLSLESGPAATNLPPQKAPTAPSPTGTPIAPTDSYPSLENAPATATPKETLVASPPKVATTIPAVSSPSSEKTPKSISPKGTPDKPSKKAPVASKVSAPKFPTEAPCVPPSPPKPTAIEAISEPLTGPDSPKGAPAALAEGPSFPTRAPKTAAPKETPPEGVTAVPLEISPSPKKTSKTIASDECATSSSKRSPGSTAPKETPTPADRVTTTSLEILPAPKKAPKTAAPKETLATPTVGVTAVPLEVSPAPKKASKTAAPKENSAPSPKKSPKTPKETPTPPSKGVTTVPLEIPPPLKAPKTAAQKQVSVTPSPKDAPATLAESPASLKTAAPKEAPATPSPEGNTAMPLQIAPSPKKAPKENSAKSSPKKPPKTATPKEPPITSSEGVTTAPLEISSPRKAPKTEAPKETPAAPSPKGSPAVPLEIAPSPKKTSKTAAPKETSALSPPKRSPKTAAPKETSTQSSEGVTTATQQEIPPSPQLQPPNRFL